jgi:hypothetical protein
MMYNVQTCKGRNWTMSVQTMYSAAMPKEVKKPERFFMRLSPEDAAYLDAVAARMGVTKTAVLMAGVRLLAQRLRIKIDAPDGDT